MKKEMFQLKDKDNDYTFSFFCFLYYETLSVDSFSVYNCLSPITRHPEPEALSTNNYSSPVEARLLVI